MKKGDDDDDAPTYVLEDTKESLTKEEYDALVSGKESKDEEEHGTDASKEDATDAEPKLKDKIAEVGAGNKKRKVGKIISDETEESPQDGSKVLEKNGAKPVKKPKKKAKAVKLTFGEEEG